MLKRTIFVFACLLLFPSVGFSQQFPISDQVFEPFVNEVIKNPDQLPKQVGSPLMIDILADEYIKEYKKDRNRDIDPLRAAVVAGQARTNVWFWRKAFKLMEQNAQGKIP